VKEQQCPTHMMHDPKKCNLDFGADHCSCGPFFPQRVCNACFMSPKRHAKYCSWVAGLERMKQRGIA
jgi:hypothetical protein